MSSFRCKSCSVFPIDWPSLLRGTFSRSSDWSSHIKNPTSTCGGTHNSPPCGRLPLYDAISHRAPDAVILTLLDSNKKCLKVIDKKDINHVLEKAIQLKYSDFVIDRMVQIVTLVVTSINCDIVTLFK